MLRVTKNAGSVTTSGPTRTCPWRTSSTAALGVFNVTANLTALTISSVGTANITVVDLVTVAAMSRRGMHKAFLEHLGRTPGQELQRVRIERAKKFLSESNHKIETVADMAGYQSTNSFCIAFKRVTGMSAKQFRETIGR
jgi:AraC-like DNA-binding protein